MKIVHTLMGLMVITFLLATSVVSAGVADYYIRVSNGVHLRGQPSTDGAVIHTVPAGTTLHVTYEGDWGNWLRVEYSGQSLWLARWLDYTVVNDPVTHSPSASTHTSTDRVDNLCQTEWTCTTQEEWERGWHAFRDRNTNGQSANAVTTATVPGVSPLPATVFQVSSATHGKNPAQNFPYSFERGVYEITVTWDVGVDPNWWWTPRFSYFRTHCAEGTGWSLSPLGTIWSGDPETVEIYKVPCAITFTIDNVSGGNWSIHIRKTHSPGG